MELKEEKANKKNKKSVASIIIKGFLWIIASLLFLIMLVLILIQTSFVQNFARKKIVGYLQNKLNTEVEIGKLDIDFPTTLSLQNIFIADQSKDTLLFGKELKVNIDMVKLISSNIDIQEIALNGIVAKVKRLPPDSIFNFQFIADAFTSPEDTTASSSDTSSMQMNIDKIIINKTRIIYKDAFTGNDMYLAIGHFDTQISTFDPAHLLFDIPSITLKGLTGHFYQMEPLKEPIEITVAEASAEPENYLQLFNKEINLSDINVAYKSEPSHINSSIVIGNAEIHPKTVDLKNSLFTLKNVLLENSAIVVEANSKATDEKPKDTVTAAPATPSMKINTGQITLRNINLKYDDVSAPKAPEGMDFSHLNISDFSLNINKLEYSADTILASVQSASMKEKSGFVLKNLTTNFYMIPTGIFLYQLLIQTPGSELKRRAYVTYSSIDAINKNIGELGLYIDLQQSRISMKDVLTFMPQLKDQLPSLSSNSTLYIDAKITGKVSDLNLQKVILRGLSSTNINISGTIKGLPDIKKTYADLTINKFQTSRSDIHALMPPNSLPQNISLPETIAVSGKINGGMNDLYVDLGLNSTSGNAKVNGTLKNITDKNKAYYDLVLHAGNLQLGKILNNPQLGALSGNFLLKGNGYDPETANATFKAIVSEVTLNNYTYHAIKAHGRLADKKYQLHTSLHDPNLDITLAVNGIFVGKYPTVHLETTIDSIKTQPLHFTSQPIIYHGKIVADFVNINPDSLNGSLAVTHSVLVNNGQRIKLDSLSLVANNSSGKQSLSLQTDFLSASIKGKYKLTQLANVFQQALNPYFSLTNKNDSVKVAPYHFTIAAGVNDNPVLRTFLPSLTQLKPIKLSANFTSDSGWDATLTSPHIVFGTSVIDSVNFIAKTQNEALIFKTSIRKVQSGSSISVYATTLDGILKNNKLDFTLNIKDPNLKNKYRLSGTLDQPEVNKYIFSLKPDSLLLNYEKWTVSEDNRIQYFNNDINAHHFILSQGSQQLSINSADSGTNSPMQVGFKNFKIETITGFVQNDSLMVAGLLNGTAVVKNIQTSPTFTTDITINELSIYQDTIGNLTAKVNNNVANTYHAEISLNGHGNKININGDYIVKPTNSSYDFVIELVSFQMKSLEGFSNGSIKNASGYLYGKIAVNGSLEQPNIDGKIHFNNTAFNLSMLNNVFKVDKEAIAIVNNKGIILNTFTIRDTHNHPIVIDGAINTPDFFNYTFNLTINARNFQAINSTSKDNKLFYGKMVFSTNLTVKGTPTHPIIDGNLTINGKTDFTIVLPQENPGVVKREGIVRFVDRSATAEDSLFMMPYDSLNTAPLTGFDVSVNIKIEKEAVFNVIVDQANGDFLKMSGTGELTGGIDASGKVTLVGSYEINEGTYNLSFNFLKRKFNIQKGSRIVWTGEPTSAQIDITAVYIAHTAPIDLVQDQIEASRGDKNIYKEKLPFEVHLSLKGELLKPEISFDIILPKDKNYDVSNAVISTVQTKLTQLRQETGEMNKQVFALLLLNRFVGEDPFSSSGGSVSAGTFAMQSVSRLLSEQLNKLAENLVEGVDINLDLATTQDYTTGTEQNRTDLNVGISKSLLSDRLTVSVGSEFELMGPMQTNKRQNNLAGNIAINYKLSKDGRYMLRAYRKNDYTGQIEGYVIETGLSFIISVDYNQFKQIFSSKEEREKKRQIKLENKKIQKENTE